MAISLTSSTPAFFQDSGAPLSSYVSQSVTVNQGQFYLDNSAETLYICTDGSNQNSLVWNEVPNLSQIPTPAPRVQSSASRSLNSGFQTSTTRDALVNYSIDIACTISLTTGQTGTVYLDIASDSGFTINLQTLASTVNGNSGTLTVGLSLTQTSTATLSGYVPAGYYCRIRTANTTGSPTFTYRYGQEILL